MTYLTLIENELKIESFSIDYFNDDYKLFETFERINNAANAMKGKLGDMTGINICIHVASSFVMLGTDIETYHQVTEEIQSKFEGIDPTIVITSASLFYILKRIESIINNSNREDLKARYLNHVRAKIEANGGELTQEKKKNIESEIENSQNQLNYIFTRFRLMNWMIGTDYMNTLQIT